MKRVFISTTNNVDNGKTVAYFGVVSSHIVAGTGFLSDFAASVSDFFGGRSGSYRRQLESLYDEALDELSDKAQFLGANSILGLKIDMDNISGKGMSMFMITAVGTAAKVIFDEECVPTETAETISSAILVNEIAKRAILKEIDTNPPFFPRRYWETILRYPDKDYVLPLTRMYFKYMGYSSEYSEPFKQNFDLFIQMVDRDLIVNAVYAGMSEDSSFAYARDLIKENSLFDTKSILNLIKGGFVKQAISVLGVEQPSYTENDLHNMEAILDALSNLPDVGKKEVIKGGMFFKDGEKYICQHGHKNNPDVEFCSDCGENIKGLGREHLDEIESFKNRVSILKELLMKQS